MEFESISLREQFPVTDPLFTLPPRNPHIHNCFEIGFCYEGGGIFQIEEKIFTCTAGNAVFINNREFHLLRGATPENTHWKFINLDPVKLLNGHIFTDNKVLNLTKFFGSTFCNLVKETEFPDITQLVRDLITELETKKKGYRDIVRAHIWLILQKMQRLVPESLSANRGQDNDAIKRIAPALHYISTNYSKNIRIDMLAKICNCSISNFRKIFTNAMHCSPQKYLIKFKLNTASLLLTNTKKQILEISEKSGFSSLSNFNRCFKDHFEMPPRQYRNMR